VDLAWILILSVVFGVLVKFLLRDIFVAEPKWTKVALLLAGLAGFAAFVLSYVLYYDNFSSFYQLSDLRVYPALDPGENRGNFSETNVLVGEKNKVELYW
jgi:hypothetical protein